MDPTPRTPLRELLSSPERMARIDVRRQARACAEDLRTALTDPDAPLWTLTGAFNKGSLMLASIGDIAEAEHSCLRQVEVLGRLLGDPERRVEAAATILRPWVNIGRLRVIQRRPAEALPYFQAVAALLQPADVVLAGVRVPAECFAAAVSQPGGENLRFWARVVLTTDHIKAYCQAGDLDALDAAIARWLADGDLRHLPHVREARAIRYASGRRDGGWSLAEQFDPGSDDHLDHVMAVHFGHWLRSRGRDDEAGAVAAHTVRQARAMDARSPMDLIHASFLRRLGELAETCADPEDARWCFQRLTDIARRNGDEPLSVTGLTALARVSPEPAAARLRAEARALADRTLYFVVRRARGGAVPLRAGDVPETATLVQREIEVVQRYAAPLPAG